MDYLVYDTNLHFVHKVIDPFDDGENIEETLIIFYKRS